MIWPTLRVGGLEELCRLAPRGDRRAAALRRTFARARSRSFEAPSSWSRSACKELADAGVDLIHPAGAPPFMVHGLAGERAICARWEQRYGIPIVTSAQSQVEALRALGVTGLVGHHLPPRRDQRVFAALLPRCGFDVPAMEAMEVAFDAAQRLSSREIYAFARSVFFNHPGADGIYLLGSGWRCLDIVEMLEQDLQVPVVHAVAARAWAIEQRLHVRHTVRGYGRLLAEAPPLVRA